MKAKAYIAGALSVALILSSCASSPDEISAQYVSPATYRTYTCDQIRTDLVRISGRVSALTGQQRRRANQDAWAVGVGMVIFWPALFFLMRGDKAEELGRLKGEYDALTMAASEKNCGLAGPDGAPAT